MMVDVKTGKIIPNRKTFYESCTLRKAKNKPDGLPVGYHQKEKTAPLKKDK